MFRFIRNIITDFIEVREFEKELKSLMVINNKREKRYSFKISEREMGLLYACYALDVHDRHEFGRYLKTISKNFNEKEFAKLFNGA